MGVELAYVDIILCIELERDLKLIFNMFFFIFFEEMMIVLTTVILH